MSFTSTNLSVSFDSRETYIEYRALWKLHYLQVSDALRKGKAEVKSTNKIFSATPSAPGVWTSLANAQLNVLKLKEKANALLKERKLSKEEAGRQYKLSA